MREQTYPFPPVPTPTTFRIDTIGKRDTISSGGTLSSSRHRETSTIVMRDVITPPMDALTKTKRYVEHYSAQLHNGELTLDANVNAIILTNGEVYVASQLTEVALADIPREANAVNLPIVVKKGAIQAGSIGTHWWVRSSIDPATRDSVLQFALLAPPKGKAGQIWIEQRNVPGSEIYIADTTTYIEIRNETIDPANPPVQRPRAKSFIEPLVTAAIARAEWAGLRDH